MKFEFRLNTDVCFGHGIAKHVPERLKGAGFSKPGLVVDEGIYKTTATTNLLSALEKSRISPLFTLKSRGNAEPDYDYLDECASKFKGYDLDCLIGVGGGSSMDLCKGISVLLKNPGKGVDYRGMNKVKNPCLPTILFPTTAGSGSEATFTAVFLDKTTKVKLGINGKNVGASMAFLDSDFTASCPRNVAIASGLDAMVHALEAYMTTEQNPIVWRISIQAWVALYKNFEAAVNNREDHEARLNMLLGSYLAGITLMYSGGGIAGALSYPLGGEYKVPHGLSGGVFLRHIMEENIVRGYEGYGLLYDSVFPGNNLQSPGEKSRRLLNEFQNLLTSIQAVSDLRDYSIPKENIGHIVKTTINQRDAVLQNNPVPVDEKMLTVLLERVLW